MPCFENMNPMCNMDLDDLDYSDYKITEERGITSETHKVINYADGSSTHIWGGPCGSTNYDKYGEEC